MRPGLTPRTTSAKTCTQPTCGPQRGKGCQAKLFFSPLQLLEFVISTRDMQAETTLYRNEGGNRFRNAGAAAGVEIARWPGAPISGTSIRTASRIFT